MISIDLYKLYIYSRFIFLLFHKFFRMNKHKHLWMPSPKMGFRGAKTRHVSSMNPNQKHSQPCTSPQNQQKPFVKMIQQQQEQEEEGKEEEGEERGDEEQKKEEEEEENNSNSNRSSKSNNSSKKHPNSIITKPKCPVPQHQPRPKHSKLDRSSQLFLSSHGQLQRPSKAAGASAHRRAEATLCFSCWIVFRRAEGKSK